jgi:hypothetical protein
MQPPSDEKEEWIMLCLDHKYAPFITLHQLRFSAAPSNFELFQRLSEEYEQRRAPYTLLTIEIRPFWRKIKAIHFVRFMTLNPQPVITVGIQDMHSLPPLSSSWVWNKMDGINALVMASFLQEPTSAGEDWSVYKYIPKARSPLSQQDGLKGWGLYVEEGASQRSKLLCVIVLLTIFYSWLFVWLWPVQHDYIGDNVAMALASNQVLSSNCQIVVLAQNIRAADVCKLQIERNAALPTITPSGCFTNRDILNALQHAYREGLWLGAKLTADKPYNEGFLQTNGESFA